MVGKPGLPTVEFEGPLEMFWDLENVPLEALAQGVADIALEVKCRGIKEKAFLDLVKHRANVSIDN